MHQYAHNLNGKTIHSSTELEHHGITVDDRSHKNSGKQDMIPHSGYVIPFNVRSGLITMDMAPPTDVELSLTGSKALPQTIITSDLDWDSSIIDYEYDSENWFDAIENLPDLDHDIPFDEYGKYLHTQKVTTNFAEIEKSFDVQNEYNINAQEVISASKEHKVAESLTDFEELQPTFEWLPIGIIQATLDRTTQFYRAPMAKLLKKHFKFPYPVCNVQRRQEVVATDTVHSDKPAVDNGSKVAQIFVGAKSLVTDVYSIKTKKQFVNTLQDMIRTHGAPTKLTSDHAQVEISNRVHDILRYLFIED